MTDTTDINDTTLSRRRALQAGIGAGVGLVAWSGASITSMGGTPAYAAACTNFTLNLAFVDMSTNQSSGCATFSYNNSPPIQVKAPGSGPNPYAWTVPHGGNFKCADTPGCYQLTFPSNETCKVEVKVHRNHYSDATVIIGATTVNSAPGGTLNFCLPSQAGNPSYGTQDPAVGFRAAFLGDNVSPTFWSVWIQCVKTSQAGCLTTTTTAGPN